MVCRHALQHNWSHKAPTWSKRRFRPPWAWRFISRMMKLAWQNNCEILWKPVCSRRYPSTMVFSGTGVWLHLQKFWMSSAESNAFQALQLGCICRSLDDVSWVERFDGLGTPLLGLMTPSWPRKGVLDCLIFSTFRSADGKFMDRSCAVSFLLPRYCKYESSSALSAVTSKKPFRK